MPPWIVADAKFDADKKRLVNDLTQSIYISSPNGLVVGGVILELDGTATISPARSCGVANFRTRWGISKREAEQSASLTPRSQCMLLASALSFDWLVRVGVRRYLAINPRA
jgi:hypothetical protein